MKFRNQAMKYGATAAVLTMSINAHAELPTWASSLFTTLTGYGTDVLAAAGPLTALVFGGMWLISLVKKGANKAK